MMIGIFARRLVSDTTAHDACSSSRYLARRVLCPLSFFDELAFKKAQLKKRRRMFSLVLQILCFIFEGAISFACALFDNFNNLDGRRIMFACLTRNEALAVAKHIICSSIPISAGLFLRSPCLVAWRPSNADLRSFRPDDLSCCSGTIASTAPILKAASGLSVCRRNSFDCIVFHQSRQANCTAKARTYTQLYFRQTH